MTAHARFPFVAIVALTAFAASASAADFNAPNSSPMTDGNPLWSGPYVSGFVGGEVQSITQGNTDVGVGPKGVSGGLRAGYDWTLPGGFLAGGFISGAMSGVSANLGDGVALDELHRFEIGGRVGKTFGSTLIYMPISYAVSSVRIDAYNVTKDLDGFRFGAGIERQLGDRWSIGIEAGRTSLSNASFDGRTTDALGVDGRLTLTKRF
jgi:hypothetical protein